MKDYRLVALALFAAVTIAFAGSASAGSGKAAGRGGSGHSAGSIAGARANTGRQGNRRFFRQNFSAFPFNGYGYGYGNQVYLNPDEADWAEQWRSLSEDNDGPYAKSTFEGNPQGKARMWEFSEDGNSAKSGK